MLPRRRLLALAGALFVLIGLGNWVAEKVWISKATTRAEDYFRSKSSQFKGQDPREAFQQGVTNTTAEPPITLVTSIPPGAEVFQAGRGLGEQATPFIIEGQGLKDLEFRTPWRAAQVASYENPVELDPTLAYRVTGLLGWLGIVLIVVGMKGSQPPEEVPEEREEIDPEEVFGDYQRLQLIGAGGMGQVFEARSLDPKDKSRYALKLLLPQWSGDEIFRARFVREGAICQKLKHPGIVRVHAQSQDEEELWLVMDLVEGRELNDWLEEKSRTGDEILTLFVKVCEALTYAHDLDVIHRDLKPENIFVTDQEQPILMDFGLARGQHYETITQAGTTLGTPMYMAPDQVKGESRDPRSDLYSLGCILYQCFAGHAPFEGDPIQVIMSQINRAPRPIHEVCDDIDPAVAELIHRLLEKKPEARYPSASALHEALLSLSS